jgi:hypothetical protein
VPSHDSNPSLLKSKRRVGVRNRAPSSRY